MRQLEHLISWGSFKDILLIIGFCRDWCSVLLWRLVDFHSTFCGAIKKVGK